MAGSVSSRRSCDCSSRQNLRPECAAGLPRTRPAISLLPIEERIGEQDRIRVHGIVPAGVAEGAEAGGLIGNTVKIVVCADATFDLNAQGFGGREAADIIPIGPVGVVRVAPAGPIVQHVRVILKVADLVGEGYIISQTNSYIQLIDYFILASFLIDIL